MPLSHGSIQVMSSRSAQMLSLSDDAEIKASICPTPCSPRAIPWRICVANVVSHIPCIGLDSIHILAVGHLEAHPRSRLHGHGALVTVGRDLEGAVRKHLHAASRTAAREGHKQPCRHALVSPEIRQLPLDRGEIGLI